MAGKPPAAAPAKASFKHNLPTNLGATYFTALHQFVQRDVPDFNTEHEKVCHDLMRACQMAAHGFSVDANLGPATPSVATGKSLYSPQRDQYNGPLQAFLQHPLSALGRPSVWQHWVKSRDSLVEDFSIFAKRCFRSEVKVVDPPDTQQDGSPRKNSAFHGGVMGRQGSMSGSFAGGFGASASFARMPGEKSPVRSPNNSFVTPRPGSPKGLVRPGTAQAPSREVSNTDVFVRCGTNSFFDPERLVLVHIWANPRAARTFVQSWRRLAQITFEHRLDMIHCPISVVNCIESTFVSVTALPPVIDSEKAPPLRDVGAKDTGFESLIDRMSRQMLEVLSSDSSDSAHAKGGLTLYPGLDGRYYLMNMHSSLHPKFKDEKLTSCMPRPELVYTRIQEKMFAQNYDQVLMEHAIPKALRALLDMLEDPSFNVDIVIRDGLCPLTFHQHGVNMKCLGKAVAMIDSGGLNTTPALGAGSPNKDRSKGVAMLRTVLITEMVGRTLKNLIRLDCHLGAAGGRDRDLTKTCSNSKARLDVVNRIARLVVGKNQDFIDNQVLPILRIKFALPDFTTNWKEVNPGTCLKILSSKFGCEFGPAEGRFHRFVPASSKDLVMLACNAPLEAVLCDDRQAGEIATNAFWTQCLSIPSDSTLYESYLIRACAMSVITNAHLGRIPRQLVDGTAPAEANAMAPVFLLQFAGVLFEHMSKESKSATPATRFLASLRDHMVEVDSRRANSTSITPEATYNSLKHIAAAPLVEKYQKGQSTKVDPTYLENAVKYFVDQPHVDFVYSAQHAQALRDVEAMIAMMDAEQLSHFLSETVESVVDALQRAGRVSNAARYCQRVAIQLMGVSLAEKSPAAAKTMRLTYSMSVKAYGIEDPRTSVALYLQCLFSLTIAQSPASPTSLGATANQCRKIYEKAMTLQPQDQKSFYRTTTVFTVLQRVLGCLDTIGDIVTATSLKSHLKLLQGLHAPVIMLQMVGRGFLVRKQKSSKFANVPAPPAKLPSLGITPGASPSANVSSPTGAQHGLTSPGGARSGGSFSMPNSFNLPPAAPGLKSPSPSTTSGQSVTSPDQGPVRFNLPTNAPPPLPPSMTSSVNKNNGSGGLTSPTKSGTDQSKFPTTSGKEPMVESLDDDDEDEELNSKPQAQFNRKPTFTRPGGMTRKSTFTTAQASNSEFGSQNQSGSFSPNRSTNGRRSLVMESSVNKNGASTGAAAADSDDDDDDEDNNESLFKLCDKDHDGLVSVDDCVGVFSTFNVMSNSELRNLFGTAAKSASKPGGKMSIKEFSVVVARAGL